MSNSAKEIAATLNDAQVRCLAFCARSNLYWSWALTNIRALTTDRALLCRGAGVRHRTLTCWGAPT